MRDHAFILRAPDKINPWNVRIVIEFMQLFKKETLILDFQLEHPEPSLVLGPAN